MAQNIVNNCCPYCEASMRTARMVCETCQIAVEGDFPERPLANLPVEQQRFIEIFVLAGGSLKEIATQAGVSYPTVRSRLDKVIAELRSRLEPVRRSKKGTRDQAPRAADIIKQI